MPTHFDSDLRFCVKKCVEKRRFSIDQLSIFQKFLPAENFMPILVDGY
jgi:hypothetical protein